MAMTLGMMASLAQATPKTSVSFLRFCVAASRMLKTVSPSQLMHRLLSFSSKKVTPSWLASSGMYSMMARRTRHCLSSANCTMAGSSDCERSSMPMTDDDLAQPKGGKGGSRLAPLFTSSSLEIMWRRTSGNSSFSICRNMGSRCAIVLFLRQHEVGLPGASDQLVFSKDRGQAANLRAQRCSDVLRSISNEVLDAGHDFVQERLSV